MTNLVSAFLLPPLNLLLIALLGFYLLRTRPRLGRALLFGALALLWICSTPFVAQNAIKALESGIHPVDVKTQPADAIVVLGGGTYFSAPEYGGMDTVSPASLVRLRYAAKLQRETGKPVLVTGGKPLGNSSSEAEQMKQVLQQEFNIPVQWIEDNSNNTWENAKYSFQQLDKAGIKRIYLVTHVWHMRRAVMAFQAAGFEVVPAPLNFSTHFKISLLSFLPRPSAMSGSRAVLHEMIGLLWYRLKS